MAVPSTSRADSGKGRFILNQLGYEVSLAYSGAEALTVFSDSHERFDLVITDYIMPEMTGVTLLQELRKIRPEIPVMVYTGFSQRLDTQRAESLGIDAVLLKPLVRDDLAQAIDQVLANRRHSTS